MTWTAISGSSSVTCLPVTLTQNSGTIALELMSKVQYAGFRTVEVPVNHYRAYGVSSSLGWDGCWPWPSAWPSCGGGYVQGGGVPDPRAAPLGAARPFTK